MKLLDKRFERGGGGTVKVKIEDDEDLWQLYNLVYVGDTVRASTWRKLQSVGTTGNVLTNKIRLNLTVKITSIDFDPQSSLIRYSGKVACENEHVKSGVFHTIEVTPVSATLSGEIGIGKECWDTVVYQRLVEACDSTSKADVAAVVLQEGIAHICLLTSSMTILKQRIEVPIPRKRRSGASQHDKTIVKFYEAVFQGVIRHVNWGIVKCLLVCSPGFVNQDFMKYCMEESVKRELKEIVKSKSKWLLAPCSSGHLHCLKEVIASKAIAAKLTDTKSIAEVKCLEKFFEMMQNDEDRVVYGPLPVFAAVEKQAVESLMILDSVFRSNSVAQRKKYVELVENVQELNGEVHIFSSMHVSGEQLSSLNGVAAILRFPCPELNELDSEEEVEIIPTNTSHMYLDDLEDLDEPL
eukprot:TRINITY_DN1212_c1_g1_i13.p1 TRINITY_DN1212_c1_g1~~TRINITY_DN1212_c1_g1_i13.p1  ORF type:complete len:410 (+),score=94.56 TRINITY_DN1212_c1_g1_i13:90-1319(+)